MSDSKSSTPRRNLLAGLVGIGGAQLLNAQSGGQGAADAQAGGYSLPEYALAQDYQSLKQSSFDRTGGNADRWPVAPGDLHVPRQRGQQRTTPQAWVARAEEAQGRWGAVLGRGHAVTAWAASLWCRVTAWVMWPRAMA